MWDIFQALHGILFGWGEDHVHACTDTTQTHDKPTPEVNGIGEVHVNPSSNSTRDGSDQQNKLKKKIAKPPAKFKIINVGFLPICKDFGRKHTAQGQTIFL